jgi:hypothetical protein
MAGSWSSRAFRPRGLRFELCVYFGARGADKSGRRRKKKAVPEHIRAKLAELLLCSGDHAGNLGPFVDQRRRDVTFRHIPSSIPKRSRQLSPASQYDVSHALGVFAP